MLTAEQIKQIYNEFFPRSLCTVENAALGGDSVYAKLFLGNGQGEFTNRISHNDPMRFIVEFKADGSYNEVQVSLTVKAKEPWLAFGSEKLRRKTVRSMDAGQWRKRCAEFRAFFDQHADTVAGCPFDPRSK